MKGSWRTTVTGWGSVISLLIAMLVVVFGGGEVTSDQVTEAHNLLEAVGVGIAEQAIAGFFTLVGVVLRLIESLAARDNKVSSEEAGAKR